MTATAVQINPATSDDYRKLKNVLQNEKIQFYTFELPSEKKLKVVLRGVITELTEEEVKTDLEEQGYPASKVIRMKGKRGTAIPLVIVEIDRQYKSIFNTTDCCGLAVTVESLRVRSGITQCHKCQLFGHVQKNCFMQYRCMKCGDTHSTHLCEKPKTTSAKCANCGGDHLSTYILCKHNPNNPNTTKQPHTMPPTNPNIWAEKAAQRKVEQQKQAQANAQQQQNQTQQQQNQTQQQQPKQTQQQQQQTQQAKPNTNANAKMDKLTQILGKMVLNISSTNATTEHIADFIKSTQQLVTLFTQP